MNNVVGICVNICCLIFVLTMQGQMEFCQGSLGEPIFYENFGEGAGIGQALPSGTTSYSFTQGFPEEGEYTLRSNVIPALEGGLPGPDESWFWHILANDWTYNLLWYPQALEEHQGKMLLVNADDSDGTYYSKRISGLCENTSYEFSVWAGALYDVDSNECDNNNGQGVPINFNMQVWDSNEENLLFEVESGDVLNSSTMEFQKYGLLFTTDGYQDEVVLKIVNGNQIAGCGNDIAIDEIRFQVCGEEAIISSDEYGENEAVFCENDFPVNLTLNLDYFGPQSHYYRWQSSVNGFIWLDIPGEEGNSLEINNVTDPVFYRVKASNNQSNLDNDVCCWFSNVFQIRAFTVNPPVSWGDRTYCGDEFDVPPAAVYPVDGISVDWYDAPEGGNLLAIDTVNYEPDGPGIYYAQAYVTGTDCIQPERTPVAIIWEPGINLPPDPGPIVICGGETIDLDAGVSDLFYQWSPPVGDTQVVTVSEPGTYTVTVNNGSECNSSRYFTVIGYVDPEIQEVLSYGTTLEVVMATMEEVEYSIDQINWQNSNIFENVSPGLVTVYVRDAIDCGTDEMQYFLLVPPKFFTPNGDGFNDYFTVKGIDEIPLMEVYVFDRYGKKIYQLSSQNPFWDGTLNARKLPSNDYWYNIKIDGRVIRSGHFTLKR